MPTTRQRYDEMIRTAIAGILRPLDFTKRHNSFFRDTGHGWILIDFQASQFGSRDDVSFTINLGVSFSELRPPNEAAPSLGRAHVQQRIGRVMGKSSDVWWSLDPTSDLTAVAAEVSDVLSRQAIPWLEQRTVLGNVLAATQLDPGFMERWHLARLRVLAERARQQEDVPMSRIRRFDHVGITVADLDTVTAFFVGLGLEVEGRTFVEGEFVDTVIGIPGSRSHIVTLRPPDGGTGLELSSFVEPDHEPGSPTAMANELGLRNVSFEVDDLHAAVDRLAADGYGLVGGIGQYENTWRMAYVRGPEGIIVSLAERIG